MLDKFIEWLSNLIFGDNNFENLAATRRLIMWVVVILAITVIVYYLIRSDFTKLVKPKSKATAFNFSEIAEDLNTIDFEKNIADAVVNNDYRLAVRWQYLRSLYLLERKGLLVFQPHKTNFDYVNDLRKTDMKQDFIELSKVYEYVWYGKFNTDLKAYENFAIDFISFQRKLNV